LAVHSNMVFVLMSIPKLLKKPNSASRTAVVIVICSLLCTGEFMLARYREVVETVLRFRESKERLIRRAVISLLPRLAAFAPERFAATYLKQCTNYLLSVLKFPSERGVGGSLHHTPWLGLLGTAP